MNKLFIIVGIALLVCLLVLFSMPQINIMQKDAYLNHFESFVEEVKEDHDNYSKADWDSIDQEYQELSVQDRESYEDLFTQEDEMRISALDGEYLSYKTPDSIDDFIETTKDAINNTVKYIEGFIEGLNTELVNDTISE